MRTCQMYEDGEPCINLVEGATDFCPRHNRLLRKQTTDRMKANEKRKAILAKPKKVYKAPNKVSPKRKEANKEYATLREQFLKEHPECELKLQPCTRISTQVHHTASGWNKATNLNNVKTWKASCDNCNQFLHDVLSASEAREKGLKI